MVKELEPHKKHKVRKEDNEWKKESQHAHDRTEIAGDTKTCIIVPEATEDDAMDAIIGGDLEQQREKKFHV